MFLLRTFARSTVPRTTLGTQRSLSVIGRPSQLWQTRLNNLPRAAGYSSGGALGKEEVTARVLDVFKGFEKVNPEKVTPAARFKEDLALDSLDAVEVVMAVEEEFSIEIPDAEADSIVSVQQAIDYILESPEGPLYDPTSGILHFVDIDTKRVFQYDVRTGSLSFDQFEETVTALALRGDGKGLACVLASGFGLIEEDEDSRRRLVRLTQALTEDQLHYTRLNDGACDARGRFIAASLHSKSSEHPIGGILYLYDAQNGTCKVLDDQDITDGNGLGFSEDNGTLYFTNSWANVIYAYDYDLEEGAVSNRRVFIDGPTLGLTAPSCCDGLCIDSEGCIWSARWAGSKIVRFSRDGTEIVLEIHFPTVYSVTAMTFADDQLYVTTAQPIANGVEDHESMLARYPDSGHLFRIDWQGRFRGGKWRHDFVAPLR